MQRALLGIFVLTIFLGACTQRMVCPAFQSAYIYDKDQLRKRFSYFQEDSTPKIYSASKTKYLIAEPVSYRKKMRTMKSVEMRPVNVVVPDSLSPDFDESLGKDGEDGVVPGAELDQAARSVIDSTYIVDVPRADEPEAPVEDSVYMISRDRELRLLKYNFPDSLQLDSASGRYVSETPYYAVVNITFNVEQDNYMWYLKDYLVLPDVRMAARKGQGGDAGDDDGTSGKKGKKKKQGIKGLFKNLFKKKDKSAEEEEETPPPAKTGEEEFDYINEDEQGQPPVTTPEEPTKEKKGLFGKKKDKKEKKKKEEEPQQPEEQPTEQKVEEDPADKIPEKVDEDGF
jgi:hypothetical protein